MAKKGLVMNESRRWQWALTNARDNNGTDVYRGSSRHDRLTDQDNHDSHQQAYPEDEFVQESTDYWGA
jgi:hypothetical protein